MKIFRFLWVFVAFSVSYGQDLPGTATELPGASTAVEPAGKAEPVKPPAPEKIELDPATVKELTERRQEQRIRDVQKSVNLVLNTIHPESPLVESSKDMLTYIFARLQLLTPCSASKLLRSSLGRPR